MLESLMKTKICPIISGDNPDVPLIKCQGSGCAAWEEHVNVNRGPHGIGATWEPRDPPEGDCGMKPQAFECNYG